jgi:hypothetical protein
MNWGRRIDAAQRCFAPQNLGPGSAMFVNGLGGFRRDCP